VENIQIISDEELVNQFLRLEQQYMFRVTSPGLGSLTFKVTGFIHFPSHTQ
jgi:hypothetical protein